MRKNITALSLLSASLIIIASCRGESGIYNPDSFYTASEKDSLMVKIVTYIGKKPRLADYKTRHNPEHLNFYTQQSKLYSLIYYHISDDSTHYYYIIRPARSARGNTRGVGGRFRINDDLKYYDFEEMFNTPILYEQELMEIGKTLFREMLGSGNIDFYLDNKGYIEWPDERLRYDKTRNEWRYDVVD